MFKKCLCLALTFTMLGSMLSTVSLATGKALGTIEKTSDSNVLTFTGDEDYLTADKTVDHTRSFMIEYDIAFDLINTVTVGNWADDTYLLISNADDSHSIKFETQTARGGEASYNLGISSHSNLGGSWTERIWNDAAFVSEPSQLENIHVKYSYDAATRVYSWQLTNNNNGAELHSYRVPADRVSDSMANDTAMTIKIYRNSTNIAITNASLTYVENTGAETLGSSIFLEGGDLPAVVSSISVAGSAHIQDLDPNTWSYGKQLFYVAESVGETAVFNFNVGKTAEYKLLLRNTKASDYGQYALYVDDVLLKEIESYSSRVAMETLDCGTVHLAAGVHQLKVVITGKNDASAGYYIGIDHLELLPEGAESYPRTSSKWQLNMDWAVDEKDSSLILTKAAVAPTSTWKQVLDLEAGIDLTSSWTIDGEIPKKDDQGGVIRFLLKDSVSGDYLAIRFHRLRNSDGCYQIYSYINMYDQSAATYSNILADAWGTKQDGSVISELTLNVKRARGSDSIIVTVSDATETLITAAVSAASFTDSAMGADFTDNILNNKEATFMVDAGEDNDHTFRLTNPVVTVPDVILSESGKWDLGNSWGVDNNDKRLILTDHSADASVWKETIDLSEKLNIATTWLVNGEITSNDTWGGGLELLLRDSGSGDYLATRFHRYRNGNGDYQVYISAQMWDDSAATWSDAVADVWYTMVDGAVPENLKIVLTRLENENALRVVLSDATDELCSAVINAASFTDSTQGTNFVTNILNSKTVNFMVNSTSNNDRTYSLTNPEFYITYYSFSDIARRTWDMSYLATRPKAGEGGQQITSYDRRSVYDEETGEYLDWAANLDGFGYLRYENGYKVLADLKGPGYLTRVWFGWDYTGNVKVYIDGNLTFDMPMVDFVRAFGAYDQLSYKGNVIGEDGYYGSNMLLIPITYNESCKILLEDGENNMFYYYVGYYNLEDGAAVESFTWPLSDANAAALEEANDKLNDKTVPTGDSNFDANIDPGETITIYESALPAAITGWSLNLNIPAEELDDQSSLAEWIVNIYWDGSEKPAVSMTVADYFGVVYGLYDRAFDSAAHGVTADGVMYTTWYMPFASAKVTLTNNSRSTRTVEASFATETLTAEEAAELTRFHGNWQRSYQGEDDRAPDAQFVYVEGEGRYVGTWLHVYQVVDNIWWGEGDEKIYIDGEKFPSWFGTGSEDYFGYTWGDGLLFDYAYYGQPIQESECNYGAGLTVQQSAGDKVNYRIHVHDNITFTTSIEFMMEKYFNENFTKYGASSFFYLTPETSDGHVSVAPTLEERLFNNDSAPSLTIEADDSKTPADFDWHTADDDFSGWLVNSDGTELYAAYDEVVNRRIWKDIITNPNNFSVELTVKIASGRAFIEIMGQTVELDCNGGNGGQIFDKVHWEWFDALNQICTVTISREDGGDLQFSLKGKCNSTPVTFTKSVKNANDTNIYIGFYESGSAAYFYDIKAAGEDCAHMETELRGVVDPSCEDEGYTGDSYCTICGKMIARGETIEALGHNFVGGYCTRCGEKNSDDSSDNQNSDDSSDKQNADHSSDKSNPNVSPDTGDKFNPLLWVTLAVLSFIGSGIAGFAVFRKRRWRMM